MVQYSLSILTFGEVIMNKPFIAIEGPIGVGKSSLAHRLSKTFGFYEEKEIVDENPFLSDFYDDIEKWSFQTEMFFLCCLLYTSPSPRDRTRSRMPSSA